MGVVGKGSWLRCVYGQAGTTASGFLTGEYSRVPGTGDVAEARVLVAFIGGIGSTRDSQDRYEYG